MYTSNLLIEVYFKTTTGHTGGVLMEKMKGNGYRLAIGPTGRLSFIVKGTRASANAESQAMATTDKSPRDRRSGSPGRDADALCGRS